MKPFSARTRYALGLSVAMVLGLLILLPGRVWGDTGSSQLMERVYQQLAALDGYAFSSTVHQTTHPLPVVANVGLSSQTSSLLVEGTIDKPADLIELNISEQSGYLLDGMGQFDLKLQAGQVWGRVGGQAWEELDAAAAPDRNSSDPAAFLQATRNVQLMGTEERLGQSYQVYSFELDGAAWAIIMRQQLQAELVRRGELAPGEVLDTLDYYEKMTGQGEMWLNESGLPQRLTFHAVYPPLPNETEYKEIETITDYSQWKGLDAATSGAIWSGWGNLGGLSAAVAQGLPKAAAQLPALSVMALLVLLVLLFPILIVRYRRSMMLYRALVLVLVGLFVVQPALNASSVQVTTERRTDRTAVALARQAENKQIQAAVDKVKADFASHFDVTQGLAASLNGANLAGADALANALAAGAGSQLDPANSLPPAGSVGVDTDNDGISDAQEQELGTNAAATDSDGDGVDDPSEVILGLNPANPDTDGDLLSDGFEVAGIQMGGKTWYLDPLSTDTNSDGVADSLECIQAIDVTVGPNGKGVKGAPKGTGLCADTDGDGIPDFADDDNDNDGVNDWIDGQTDSRFGDMATGVKDSTFAYGLDNYTGGKPLRVTFELRPTDAQHLWYSMNVLDWPSEDFEGQIKRVHDTKLGTTGAAANGDMQLVPMIEVLLPGDEAIHLPTLPGKAPVVGDNTRLAEWLDMDVLQRYQMAVTWTPDKQSIQVYLPATLIRDPKGNAPVNFVGKMLYWPNGTGLFSKNHTARLVWLVQMDTDNCVVPDGSDYDTSCRPAGSNYQNGINWKTTQKQLVHRYYDSFFLTAFTAEEDLSAQGQIFYENPALVSNPAAYVPDQLLGLGTVMESYLRQKKSPTEALQAYKAKSPNLGSRLIGGSVIQDPDTYGLMAKIATQEAPALLDTIFKPYKDQLPYPTMLYVTWGESKVTGLSGVSVGDALRLNMGNAAKKNATNIRLGAFSYNANPASIGGRLNPNWDSADPGKIWTNYLQGKSVAAYEQLPQTTKLKFDSELFQQTTLGVFWNLARGVTLPTDLSQPIPYGEPGKDAGDLVSEAGAAFDNYGQNAIGATIPSPIRS